MRPALRDDGGAIGRGVDTGDREDLFHHLSRQLLPQRTFARGIRGDLQRHLLQDFMPVEIEGRVAISASL
jgi:hypothetical protein